MAGPAAGQAVWADEVEGKELEGTRWAEEEQPASLEGPASLQGWRALGGRREELAAPLPREEGMRYTELLESRKAGRREEGEGRRKEGKGRKKKGEGKKKKGEGRKKEVEGSRLVGSPVLHLNRRQEVVGLDESKGVEEGQEVGERPGLQMKQEDGGVEDGSVEDGSAEYGNVEEGSVEEGGNKTRQLEVVAFPVGIAIGAIGAVQVVVYH